MPVDWFPCTFGEENDKQINKLITSNAFVCEKIDN